MKVAIFSESSTDEASLKILIEGILGEEIEEIPYPNHLRSRGSGVPRDVPFVLRGVYYNTEAEFLITVRDSDDSPIHKKEHLEPDNREAEKCRLCDLRHKVESALENLTPMVGKENFKVAVGVAVPAIEAWLLCGKNPAASEATWINKQKEKGFNTYNDRKELKIELYGAAITSREIMIERGTEAAQRLAEDINQLEQLFPEGFGGLSSEVRGWKK
jgi:hypothetical protein